MAILLIFILEVVMIPTQWFSVWQRLASGAAKQTKPDLGSKVTSSLFRTPLFTWLALVLETLLRSLTGCRY